MSKVVLDMVTFKALASETRLDILRALDGKKLSLKDLEKATKLNKATLHEHLQKLTGAGLVKKSRREGHKWVYYRLTWKGECLLHPDNAKIVVMFTSAFITLAIGVIQLINFVKGYVISNTTGNVSILNQDGNSKSLPIHPALGENSASNTFHDPTLQWIGIICIAIFCILFMLSIYKLRRNRRPKL